MRQRQQLHRQRGKVAWRLRPGQVDRTHMEFRGHPPSGEVTSHTLAGGCPDTSVRPAFGQLNFGQGNKFRAMSSVRASCRACHLTSTSCPTPREVTNWFFLFLPSVLKTGSVCLCQLSTKVLFASLDLAQVEACPHSPPHWESWEAWGLAEAGL